MLLLDGDDWLHLHPAMTAFESAVAAGDMPPVTLVFLPAKDRTAEFGAVPSCGRRSGTNCCRWWRSPGCPPTRNGWWSRGRVWAG